MSPASRHRPPKAVILAAGLGTRLAPLTDRTAKPLAPIVNRPVMEHILRLLARHGVTEVFVNLHHYAEDIRAYFGDGRTFGQRITYHVEPTLLGTAGGVGDFREQLTRDPFLVVSGDALTDADLTSLVTTHRRLGGVATIAAKRVADPSHYGVIVHDDGDRVGGFQEKPRKGQALSDLCNCGIYCLEPRIFETIPADTFVDFAMNVFPRLLAEAEPFHVWRLESYWNDVGSIKQYRKGNFDALVGRVSVEIPGRELRLGVWAGDDTEIADEVEIVPPVLLGNRCRIESGARLIGPLIVGDGCSVGRGAMLEGVIHWDGGRADAGASLSGSIVGRDVRVESGATVHRGAVIGDGSAVRAGAVVKADSRVPPHCVVEPGGGDSDCVAGPPPTPPS